MIKMNIPQLIPNVGKEELANLEQVINNKWITEGPFSERFLDLVKDFTGAKHALLVNNGTLALYLSLLGLEIKPGDEVIVPDFTFIASGSSVAFAGGTPVFVDVNLDDYQIDVNRIEEAITEKTKAIMPVHIYGQAANMDSVIQIAKKYRLKVIEDAAQAFGVFHHSKHAGTLGDISMISFFADKTITTGEGAVILTNNDTLFEKIKLIRNQGRPNSGTFIHQVLGMNFRMTDLQCAVGVAQIEKYEDILQAKIKNYNLYKSRLESLESINFMKINEYSNLVPFRAAITLNELKPSLDALEQAGVQTRGYFHPMHKQPCFTEIINVKREYPNSTYLNNHGLALPVYPGLSEDAINYICDILIENNE